MINKTDQLRRKIARKATRIMAEHDYSAWPSARSIHDHIEAELALTAKSLKEELMVHQMYRELHEAFTTAK